MKTKPFRITVIPENSREEFRNTCSKVENAIPGLRKGPLVFDVDGAAIQAFYLGEEEIIIYDDYDVGVVRIESDVDIGGIVDDYWATHKRHGS